jgi:hypothetical protein
LIAPIVLICTVAERRAWPWSAGLTSLLLGVGLFAIMSALSSKFENGKPLHGYVDGLVLHCRSDGYFKSMTPKLLTCRGSGVFNAVGQFDLRDEVLDGAGALRVHFSESDAPAIPRAPNNLTESLDLLARDGQAER